MNDILFVYTNERFLQYLTLAEGHSLKQNIPDTRFFVICGTCSLSSHILLLEGAVISSF